MRIGYARVSTSEQDTALQVRQFRSAEVDVYFEDAASGVKVRPELDKLVSWLQPGDEVVVYKVDRIARSLDGLLRVLTAIAARGAQFRSLTEPFDTTTITGRLMLQMLGAFAEFERGMIRERCAAGRAAAVARGVRLGRPRSFSYERMVELRSQGLTCREVERSMGLKRGTVHAALGRLGLPTVGVVS